MTGFPIIQAIIVVLVVGYFVGRAALKWLKTWFQKLQRDVRFDELNKQAAPEIEALNAELFATGIPAQAKILRRVGRGFSVYDDMEYYFLELEIDRGDGSPYRVTKYRPWLPDRSLDPEDRVRDRKPYYWHIELRHEREFRPGAVQPVRIHPKIPELLDFEIHFDQDKLQLSSHQANYPDAFLRWKSGKADNSIEELKKLEASIDDGFERTDLGDAIRNFFSVQTGEKPMAHVKLISRLERELKENGISTIAKVTSFKRDVAVYGPLVSKGQYTNHFMMALKVEKPEGGSYGVRKRRPWHADDLFCWHLKDRTDQLDRLMGDATFPVVVHPQIPEIVELEFELDRSPYHPILSDYLPIDDSYEKERFDEWLEEMKLTRPELRLEA